MMLDEVIRNLYPNKYSIVVMVMSHMICNGTKSGCLNFQGMRYSYSNPYCWISFQNRKPRYGIHYCKAT
jgi:hypothetical protein